MLKKCLKYDLRASFRLWLIISIAAISSSIILGLSIVGMEVCADIPILSLLSAFAMMPTFMIMIIYPAAVMLILCFRCYTSFFTDEGYLTFTLPVKRSTHLNSKIICMSVYMIATLVILLVSILIATSIATFALESEGMLAQMFSEIGYAISQIAGSGVFGILILITVPISAVAFGLFGILFNHFCITFGSMLAKRMKLLAIIATFYVSEAIIGVISYIVFILGMFAVTTFIVGALETVIMSNGIALVWLAILATTSIVLIISGLLYRYTLSLLERNLNLA